MAEKRANGEGNIRVRPATAARYHLIIETYAIPRIGKIKPKKLAAVWAC